MLLAILAALLFAHILEFILAGPLLARAPTVSLTPEFTLRLWGTEDMVYQDNAQVTLPMFEPKSSEWTIGGDRIPDLAKHVSKLEVGPHGSHPSLFVKLPADANVEIYRRAVASLAEQGMCQVGIYAPAAAKEYLLPDEIRPSEHYVSVYRVVSVKRDNGTLLICRDRFPPWAPG